MKIFVNGRRPDSTLGKRKIVIGMLIAGMMNKKIVRHFQACEFTISSLRTKLRQLGTAEKPKSMPTDHVRPPGERTLTRCRRSGVIGKSWQIRIPSWLRNALGTRICAKTVHRRLKGARLRLRRLYIGGSLNVYINV